ncbi:MAG: hypothetical protein HYZ14_12505 [Bacteroidetes bacterium]|nr:hypothetical protein [Bacteroidota bacterium]
MSELVDPQIEKEINQQIFEAAQRLFNQLEKEMNSPDTRKLYLTGERDMAVRKFMDPLLEAIALRIIEKDALIKSTSDEATIDQLKEELFFYVDLFYSVVTSAIEIAVLRRNDISNSTHLLFLFATMETLMANMTAITELENLRNVLRDLSDNYPEKPELQKRIALLVPAAPAQNCIYEISPPKALHEYQNGEILGSVTLGGIAPPAIAGLPAGIALNAANGALTVEDATQLVQGIYRLFIKTVDGESGTTESTLDLTIGAGKDAVYTVNPPKKTGEYTTGEVLAIVNDPDGEIVSAKVIDKTGSGQDIMPQGVAMDPVTGLIFVADSLLLLPGNYYLSVITKDIRGFETTHQVVLFFETDHAAVYKVNPPNELKQYRNNQVLATVSDPDGGVVSAVLTSLPEGIIIDPASGDIVIQDKTKLKEGTYKFNILYIDPSGIQKKCTVEFTLGNNVAEYYYIVSNSKKVQNYLNGDKLAELNNPAPEIEFLTLVSGKLPAGSLLSSVNGSITVANPSLLEAGTYELKILIKPLNGARKVHDLFIEIEPDYKAVYKATYAKDITDYSVGEIIAEALDPDTVIQAELTGGTLPPGTTLDTTTGQITIADTSALVAGKYVLLILTTDAQGGETTSRIALYFEGTDSEAVYTILPPKAVDSYVKGDILATVEDTDRGVVKAVVSKGALPLGTALDPVNGNVFISDPALLNSGTSGNIFIKTTDGNGGITESELELTILGDIEISYFIYPPKVVTAHVNGNFLSELVSPNSNDIKSVVQSAGKLPPGTKLNSLTGAISVYDQPLLAPGKYAVSLRVTDKNGGVTDLSFELFLLADEPAVWWVIAPTPVDLLTNGTIIAYPTDPNGPVIDSKILLGNLSPGMVMDPLSGTITVNDPAALIAGVYSPQMRTKDVVGGVTLVFIEITLLNTDQEAIYTILPAKNIDSYLVNDQLATASDPNGPIVGASIISGAIPSGASLETNGTIKVSDPTALVPGVSAAVIRTSDNLGFMTDSVVMIEILPDTEAQYTVAPPMNYDTVQNGTLLAAVTDSNAALVTATLVGGSIPAGTTLYPDVATASPVGREVGDIVVTDVTSLIPGIYSGIQIQTVDQTGGKTSFNLQLQISPDNDAVYTVQFARDLHSYRNDDIIAFPVDPDGPVISTSLVSGSLHSGLGINTSKGAISVVSRTAMVGGFKSPGINTVDASGGLTQQVIGIEVKNLPDRTNRQQQNLFVKRFTFRLDEFEALFEDRLSPAFAENRALIDNTKPVADNILASLENTITEAQFWTGAQEDYISSNFLTITEPVKNAILNTLAVIQGGGTPEEMNAAQRDLMLRTAIYNEMFVSMIGLTGYRNQDISGSDASVLQQMFNALEAQFDQVITVPELAYLLENIGTIATGTNPLFVNFIERLNTLAT